MNKPELAHLINLISIAMIDGKISDEEKNVIYSIAESLGATKQEFEFCVNTAKEKKDTVIIEVPETDEEKTFFLKNLTLTMMSDGQIDENEKQYIEFIADKFGYDGEKALDILIKSVTNDIREHLEKNQGNDSFDTHESDGPSNTHETGKTNDAIEQEELQKEIREAVKLGKEALMKHDIPTAFDNLIYAAHMDRDACRLFMMIINVRSRLFKITKEQVAMLKDFAEKDYAISQYAYGRWLEAHRPESDSLSIANEYFKKAEKAGIGDATFVQSVLMKAGHYGMVDRDAAKRLVDEAIDKNSFLAYQYVLRQTIYGWNNMTADPQKVIDGVKEHFTQGDSDDILKVNPSYYSILGEAYAVIDDKKNAERYFRKAINMGYTEAWFDLCCLYEEDESCSDLIEQGCEAGDANCFVLRASEGMKDYDENHKKIWNRDDPDFMEDLITASELGCDTAPYLIGDIYYEGDYGYKKDLKYAWDMFIEGTKRDDGDAYFMLANMVSNDENPYELSDKNKMAEYLAIMALRNKSSFDVLDIVVEAYRDGDFTDYAAEIERYYIPEYDQNHEGDEEDEGDDDENNDEESYNLIAIVKTDGKADIIEFDVEAGWNELPEFIGADRLDAIRTQPLYDITNDMEFNPDHITAWVDSNGLLKDLPMNPIGCKLYPGPIAGDMILTLEDAKYNPKSFEYISDLKNVISALGAEVDQVLLDDGPDDDGRYDAWS